MAKNHFSILSLNKRIREEQFFSSGSAVTLSPSFSFLSMSRRQRTDQRVLISFRKCLG